MKGVLFFRNDEKIAGEINISFEEDFNTDFDTKPIVKFIRDGKKEVENISLNDIAGYAIGSDFFALKKIDVYSNNIHRLLFVKRLTNPNSKIQLYELYESGRGNATGETNYSYHLSLPTSGFMETINSRSNSLMPFFDQKMSEIVSDCPSLSKKIRTREKGYFIPLVTLDIKKHPEVLLKIINEYNNCK
ncbi:MAG: hypothetical protein JST75_03930 [Bacteroidetes bacterium]|nr:hypothetical protein [Bacteroidota bacterium]